MDVVEVVRVFARHGCRFVVVGSGARALLGEPVHARDVDIVIDAQPANRGSVVAALCDLGGRVRWRGSWVPVAEVQGLPWEWGFRSRTAFGELDVISRFIDDTSFDDCDQGATPTALPCGQLVRCHPTRHAS